MDLLFQTNYPYLSTDLDYWTKKMTYQIMNYYLKNLPNLVSIYFLIYLDQK